MKKIGKKSKFTLILFSILAIAVLPGLIWYIISICNKYTLMLLIMNILFSFLFILFLGISINQFRKRNDGIFMDGEYIIIITKGKKIKLLINNIKEIKYYNYRSRYFNFTRGDLFINNLKITEIKDVRKVASYLINEINKENNDF